MNEKLPNGEGTRVVLKIKCMDLQELFIGNNNKNNNIILFIIV